MASKSDMIAAFAAIDKKYNSSASMGLEKINVKQMTDDEIRKAAEEALAYGLSAQKSTIEESAKKAAAALEEKKTSLMSAGEEKQATVDGYYDDRRKQAENEALRRGLARSSVIMGQIDSFDKGRIEDKSTLMNKLSEELSAIDGQILNLTKERDKALAAADASHASQIAKEIKALYETQDKKIAEAVKYNNTITEQELAYSEKNKKATANQKSAEKLGEAKKYYDALSRQEALDDFYADKTLHAELGSYYAYLLNYLQNRK